MPLRYSTGLRNKLQGERTNIASNGAFTSDTTGWTASGATLASASGAGSSGNGLRITNSGAAKGSAYQDLTTRAGRIYLLTLSSKVDTATSGEIRVGTTADDDSVLLATFTDSTHAVRRIAFVAPATTTRLTLAVGSATSGHTADFDEVVVEEVLDGLREILRGSRMNIYTGTQPTTADDAATGTLLVTIAKGGTDGFEWDPASSGTISKPTADNWQGTTVATGTAGWFRLYEEGDNPANASSTAARFDGQVATSGAQLNVSSTSFVSGAVQTVSSFTVTQPAA